MASNTLIGTITEIKATEIVSDKFSKREFLVTEIAEQYAQTIPFIFVQDKCSALDTYKVNDQVTVSYNIRSNEHKGRYYVNLNAWRIEKYIGDGGAPAMQQNTVSLRFIICIVQILSIIENAHFGPVRNIAEIHS